MEEGFRRKGLGRFMMKVLTFCVLSFLRTKFEFDELVCQDMKTMFFPGVGDALPQGGHVEADGDDLQEGLPPGRVFQEGA